jgi:O-antigen ligase
MTMPATTARTRTPLVSALRGLQLLAIACGVISFGAVEPIPYHLSAFLHALVLVGAAAVRPRSAALARVLQAALVIALMAGLYVVFQAWTFAGNPFANPIWQTAHDLLGTTGGAISVAPGKTIDAAAGLVVPFFVFASVLLLYPDDDAAFLLWRRLALFGGAVAAFGLLRLAAFRHFALFGESIVDSTNVTTVFVNRNSAAGFLGIALLLLFGLAVRRWVDLNPHQALEGLIRGRWGLGDRYGRFVSACAIGLVTLVALLLTRSRGGVGAAFLALLLAIGWTAYTLAPRRMSGARRLVLGLAFVIVMIAAFAVFAAQTILRAENQGFPDARWCTFGSTIRAIRDHPWLGTGYGTFQDAFPAYRDPACGIYGIWDHAHNSFLEGYLGLGLPFALLLLVCLGGLLAIFVIGYRQRRRYRFAAIAGIAILLFAMVHSLVDFPLEIPGIAAYFAAALGAAAVICLGRVGAYRRSPG